MQGPYSLPLDYNWYLVIFYDKTKDKTKPRLLIVLVPKNNQSLVSCPLIMMAIENIFVKKKPYIYRYIDIKKILKDYTVHVLLIKLIIMKEEFWKTSW